MTNKHHYFFIPPSFDIYIQNQHNSASDESAGENYKSSDGLDQSTKHHGNMDVKDNDDSHSYETPQKNFRYYSSGHTIIITTTS